MFECTIGKRNLGFGKSIRVAAILGALLGTVSLPRAVGQQDPFKALVRPTPRLAPRDELQSFTLPEGFGIQLFAAEPAIHKPLNMAFDVRGRMWITDTVEYPFPAPPGRPGRDRVQVLEDTDGNGTADRVTTFADGLNIPIGILPYRNGAIVFSIPNIVYLQDRDGDGRCDHRVKLIGPFDYSRDTHGLNNAFRRSFDGWIYACHGFNNHSQVHGSDGHIVDMTSGNTYRFRPDGSRIEHFTHGQVNPFGMTIDEWGDFYTADCHSKPLTHLVPGAYYPSFGRPHDGLGFAPELMAHLHGSTAIAGASMVDSQAFPGSMRGTLLSGNVMTSRVNHNRLESHGATLRAVALPDFLATSDPWFRPVDLRFGPDGALYVADFYNRIIGHYEVPLDHPGRDRSSGRIWRISYANSDASHSERNNESVDQQDVAVLHDGSDVRLWQLLDHPQVDVRVAALNELADRSDDKCAEAARTAWTDASARQRICLMWLEFRTEKTLSGSTLWQEGLNAADPRLRAHSWKIVREASDAAAVNQERLQRGLDDDHPRVQMAAVLAAARHVRRDFARAVLNKLAHFRADDAELRYALRMAVRNQLRTPNAFDWLAEERNSAAWQEVIADVLPAVKTAPAAQFLLDQLTASGTAKPAQIQYMANYVAPESIRGVLDWARAPREPDVAKRAVNWLAIANGWRARGAGPIPDSLATMAPTVIQELLVRLPSDEAQRAATVLSAAEIVKLTRDDRTREIARKWLREKGSFAASDRPLWSAVLATERRFVLASLVPVAARPGMIRELASLAGKAIERNDEDDRAIPVLRRVLREAPAVVQTDVARVAAQYRPTAKLLADEILSRGVSAQLLADRAIQQQLLGVLEAADVERLSRALPSDAAQARARLALARTVAAAYRKAPGRPAVGQQVFEKNCAICHQLAGKGALIGPQLDGIGLRGLDRLVEDMIDPNRNVDPKFRASVLRLSDGRVLTGLVRNKTPQQWLLADQEGKELVIPVDEIEESKELETSLMPVDQAKSTGDVALRDLLAFLLSRTEPVETPRDSNQ